MCCQSRKNLPCFRVWYSTNSVFMKNPLSLFDQVSSEECSSGIDPSQTYVSSQTILKDENPLSLFDSSQWFSTHYPLPCLFLDVFRAESDFMSLSLLARVPSWVCSTLNLKLYKKMLHIWIHIKELLLKPRWAGNLSIYFKEFGIFSHL